MAMEHHFPATEAPARRLWETCWVPKLREFVSADILRACVGFLYWIYVGEQILQRDSSSIIHSAFIFENICSILLNRVNVPNIQRMSPLLLADANIQAIHAAVGSRRELVTGNGVYNLCLCLWPMTDNPFVDHAAAMEELANYVSKCWTNWQTHQGVFAEMMPQAFRVNNVNDPTEMEEKQSAFLEEASIQLTMHLTSSTASISNAKRAHTATSAAVFQCLTTGFERPAVQRGSIRQDRFKLRHYWMLVHSDLPVLHMVFNTLAAVCATEAGCERIFSKNGFVHNELRNRLSHGLVVALMRNSMNAEGFDGILNGEWIWDFDGAFDDAYEMVEYEE